MISTMNLINILQKKPEKVRDRLVQNFRDASIL